MKSYLCLFLVLVFCGKSYTLKCYDCEAETLFDCRRGSQFVKNISCGLEHPNFYRFCITLVYYDKREKNTKVKMGCELLGNYGWIENDEVILKTIPQCTLDTERYDLRDCRICAKDYCGYLTLDQHSGQDSGQFLSIYLYFYVFVLQFIVLSFDIFFT